MKIPKRAKKVFSGLVYDVYHWRQKRFDNTLATFEGLKRPDSVSVIAVSGKKILIAHEGQPHLGTFMGLFGGQLEPGETPLACAKREFFEEAGYVSDDWQELWRHGAIGNIDANFYTFLARSCRPISSPQKSGGERLRMKKVSFSDFLKIVARPDWRDFDVALEIFRLTQNKKKLERFKKELSK